jgi:hypothetical protein
MTIQCQDALPLVPLYLDGELSEAQAGPLRKHLLSCHPCRSSVQDDKALKRWFAAGPVAAAAVPNGFAVRVARRAFAGDTGESERVAARTRGSFDDEPQEAGRLLQFVLALTTVAAAALLIAAIALRGDALPDTHRLRADEAPKPVVEVLQALDRLNEKEFGTRAPTSNDGPYHPQDQVPTTRKP